MANAGKFQILATCHFPGVYMATPINHIRLLPALNAHALSAPAKVGYYRGAPSESQVDPGGFNTAETAIRPLWGRRRLGHPSPLNVSRSSTSPLKIYLFSPLGRPAPHLLPPPQVSINERIYPHIRNPPCLRDISPHMGSLNWGVRGRIPPAKFNRGVLHIKHPTFYLASPFTSRRGEPWASESGRPEGRNIRDCHEYPHLTIRDIEHPRLRAPPPIFGALVRSSGVYFTASCIAQLFTNRVTHSQIRWRARAIVAIRVSIPYKETRNSHRLRYLRIHVGAQNHTAPTSGPLNGIPGGTQHLEFLGGTHSGTLRKKEAPARRPTRHVADFIILPRE